MSTLKKHPVLYSILFSEIFGIILCFLLSVISRYNSNESFIYTLLYGLLFGIVLIYPAVLTIINIIFIFIPYDNDKLIPTSKIFDFITITLGLILSFLYLTISDIIFTADYMVTLNNNEIHTPIFTQSYPTIIIIAVAAILGYIILSVRNLSKMPPLQIVLSISAIYLGIMECTLFIIQTIPREIPLSILPLNCILIAIKLIKYKIKEWKNSNTDIPASKSVLLCRLNHMLINSNTWPLWSFLLMWPLLGIIICILVLFGQAPDAAIKAWTETSQWSLSKRVSPQNIYFDEHYLCTVAAGGHKQVVKPLRLGIRHGHKVIVNRQLLIANAFEQLLEERIPFLHKHIRHFYDTYGFPIAKLIHSPYAADMIYVIMKPLEWFFLIVLYSYDINPENRIAVQYIEH